MNVGNGTPYYVKHCAKYYYLCLFKDFIYSGEKEKEHEQRGGEKGQRGGGGKNLKQLCAQRSSTQGLSPMT